MIVSFLWYLNFCLWSLWCLEFIFSSPVEWISVLSILCPFYPFYLLVLYRRNLIPNLFLMSAISLFISFYHPAFELIFFCYQLKYISCSSKKLDNVFTLFRNQENLHVRIPSLLFYPSVNFPIYNPCYWWLLYTSGHMNVQAKIKI